MEVGVTRRLVGVLLAAFAAVACGRGRRIIPPSAVASSTVHAIALPGAPSTGVSLDYLAYDRAHHRVWVPAGETGNITVVDVGNEHLDVVAGFATGTIERNGAKRRVGPSAATVGVGTVYVGNRADSSVCAVDASSL